MAWPMTTVQLLGSVKGLIKIGDINLLKGVNIAVFSLAGLQCLRLGLMKDCLDPLNLGSFNQVKCKDRRKGGLDITNAMLKITLFHQTLTWRKVKL